MPVYEYEIPEANATILLARPVRLRDAPVVVRRRTVPARVALAQLRHNPQAQGAQVLAGYRRLEERGKLRHSRYTPDQIKRAWAGG
jgi:hypothetical protein